MRSLLILISMILAAGSVTAGSDTSAGRSVYVDNCQRCHGDTPRFSTGAGELRAVLVSGTIRSHRFRLTDPELEQLIAYLAGLTPDR